MELDSEFQEHKEAVRQQLGSWFGSRLVLLVFRRLDTQHQWRLALHKHIVPSEGSDGRVESGVTEDGRLVWLIQDGAVVGSELMRHEPTADLHS